MTKANIFYEKNINNFIARPISGRSEP